jgi:hypothetical protein
MDKVVRELFKDDFVLHPKIVRILIDILPNQQHYVQKDLQDSYMLLICFFD